MQQANKGKKTKLAERRSATQPDPMWRTARSAGSRASCASFPLRRAHLFIAVMDGSERSLDGCTIPA